MGLRWLLPYLLLKRKVKMALSNDNLQNVPFQRVWSRMTAAEAKLALVAYGHCSSSVTVSSNLRPDGVLTELEYNDGQGTVATASARRKYSGGLFSQKAYLVRAALATSFEADRSAFLAAVGTDARALQLVADEPLSTTAGGAQSTITLAWSTIAGGPYANMKLLGFPAFGNSGATLVQPNATTVYNNLSAITAGYRGIKIAGSGITNIGRVPLYDGSEWRGAQWEGDHDEPTKIPGITLTDWIAALDDEEGDFRAFLAALKTAAGGDATFLNHVALDFESCQGWFVIANATYPGGTDYTGGSGQANTGKFVASNGVSTAWPDEWTAFQAAVPGMAGSDWSAIDGVSSSFDERIFLVDAEFQKRYATALNTVAGIIQEYFPACVVSVYSEVTPSANAIYDANDTLTTPSRPLCPYGALGGYTNLTPAPDCYGVATDRWFWSTETRTAASGTAAWAAFTFEINRLRCIQAATTKDRWGWIGNLGMTSPYNAWGANFYEEAALHLLLMGYKPLFYNPEANAAQTLTTSNLLAEYDAAIGYAGGTPEIFGRLPWNPNYIASMQDAGGRHVWRVTPSPALVTTMTQSADGVLFDFGGAETLSIPRGRRYHPATEYASAGYWIIAPASVASAATGGLFRRTASDTDLYRRT